MKTPIWWMLLPVLLGGAAFYFWQKNELPVPLPPPPLVEAPPASEPKPEAPIRHPIKAAPTPEKPLPSLGESDAAMQEAFAGFFDSAALEKFFDLKDIVRRIVVTVDNLPRSKMPMRYRLFTPAPEKFLATGKDENLFIGDENYRRYTPYVLLSEAVDIKKLVATYVHFYPLFQQEYQNLGYPKGYFNDRLVETIDNLLETPDVKERIKLVQPNVMYRFDDPKLEALSAGQKAMLRMGPENATRIKARLRQIRQELTGQLPDRR